MKIAVDATRAINEKAGVGRFTKDLIDSLLLTDKRNTYVLFFNFWRNYKEKGNLAQRFKKEKVEVKISRFPGKVKEKLQFSKLGYYERMKIEADVFLAPTFLDVDLGLKTPQIMVVHDMTIFKFPEHLGTKLSRKYQKMMEQASDKVFKIIVPSKSTKQDLMDILKIPEAKIEVVYPGFVEMKAKKTIPLKLSKKSYILNVGTIEPRKNLENLLDGYSQLATPLKENYPLVVVGASGWNNTPIYRKYNDLNLQNKVIFTGFLQDEELASLYKNAALFVYPSLYEGFGLPVLEALNFSLPIITSKISSLPEVAGNAALYVDPNNAEEIKEQIKKLLTNEKIRKKLIKKTKFQAKKFSWEKASRQFIKVFKSATI